MGVWRRLMRKVVRWAKATAIGSHSVGHCSGCQCRKRTKNIRKGMREVWSPTQSRWRAGRQSLVVAWQKYWSVVV